VSGVERVERSAAYQEVDVVKGFKDFLLRGNVVDLAVAVVIGTAFAGVIKIFVDSVVQPIINATGSAGSPALGFFLKDHDVKTFVNIGAIINAIIYFAIVAAVVYFVVVVPMNKLMERRRRGEEPEVEAPSEDILLLQEIRDLLRARGGQV
jgi:large conductance mechanosensitive channel